LTNGSAAVPGTSVILNVAGKLQEMIGKWRFIAGKSMEIIYKQWIFQWHV
jgi:hypothetical protein